MKKVVVITGASSGLGKELAKLYLERNYSLILCGKNEKGLEEFRERADIITGDLTAKETLDEIEEVVKKQNRIDILINNAGIIYIQPFEENTEVQLDTILAIDLKVPMLLTHRLYPLMKAQLSGHIININSTAGKEGKENHTLYCAAKWGLAGFTASLRTEAKKYNIRVTSIHPGGINTSFYDELDTPPNLSTFMNPAEVAKVIVQLSETEGISPDEIVINRMSK